MRRSLRRGLPGWRGVVAGTVVGTALALTSLTILYGGSRELLLPHLPPADQYTLPSLEEVLQSSSDLDLKRVLRQYKTSQQQVPPSTPPVRLVLSSSWRSGSTLMGEVLAAHPGVYYHYEPLMPYGVRQVPEADKDAVNSQLSDLFRCDYRRLDEYLRFAFVNADLFARNTRLWTMCSALPRTKCYAPDILGKLCALFPVHLAKLVRVRLSLLESQLLDPRVRLMWLVRDPRAVMNSRINNVDWCITPSCRDPGIMCSNLYSDYLSFLSFRAKYPDKVMLVRYEDLARDAYNKSREVLEFAGMTLHPQVVSYLDEHLSSNVDVPWSTKHEPKTTMSRWLMTMSWDQVLIVQRACATSMKALGYLIFQTPAEHKAGNAVGSLNLPE